MTLAGLMSVAENLRLAPEAVSFNIAALGTLKLPVILHWGFSHYVVLAAIKGNQLSIFDPGHGQRVLTISEATPFITGVAIEFDDASIPTSLEGTVKPLRFLDLLPNRHQVLAPACFAAGISLCLELLSVLTPYIVARIIDANGAPSLQPLSIALLAIVALSALAITRVCRGVLVITLSSLTQRAVMNTAFDRLLKNPASFFEQRYSTYVVSRFEGTDRLRTVLSDDYLQSFIDVVLLAVLIAAMMSIHFSASLIASACALLVASVRYVIASKSIKHLDNVIHARSIERLHLLETVRSVRVLKQLSKTEERHASFSKRLDNSIAHQSNYAWYKSASDAASSYIGDISVVAITFMVATYATPETIGTGGLLTFVLYIRMLMDRATHLSGKLAELGTIGVQLEHLSDIVEEQPSPTAAKARPASWGDLSVRGLCFAYDEAAPLVRDLSFRIASGQMAVLRGPSGRGKTTVLKLLSGLLAPTSGTILWSGLDVQNIAPRDLQKAIGFVFQDDELLEGDLLGNITLFERDPDIERVWQACRTAKIAGDIEEMPMRLQTMIGERGSSLSGGQRQRVLLARALYHRPQVLLLDEATSQIDTQTERRIYEDLKALGMTLIVVTHRPDVSSMADCIVQIGHNPDIENVPTLVA